MKNSKKQSKRPNPLSVNTFPYRKLYYITHPWKIIKEIYWNIRNFWHRGRFGYAYTDVWNFCDWYPRVGAEALRYLARHNSGHPADYTEKEWREHLEYMSKRLTRCADSFDICFGEERNEYDKDFHAMMARHRMKKVLEDGSICYTHTDFTPEEETLRDNYFRRCEEIAKADQEYLEDTYKWLGEDLPKLWD